MTMVWPPCVFLNYSAFESVCQLFSLALTKFSTSLSVVMSCVGFSYVYSVKSIYSSWNSVSGDPDKFTSFGINLQPFLQFFMICVCCSGVRLPHIMDSMCALFSLCRYFIFVFGGVGA